MLIKSEGIFITETLSSLTGVKMLPVKLFINRGFGSLLSLKKFHYYFACKLHFLIEIYLEIHGFAVFLKIFLKPDTKSMLIHCIILC